MKAPARQQRGTSFDPTDSRREMDELKARLSIFAVWTALHPGTKAPMRNGVYDTPWANNHGSFSIFKNGTAWKDHATGKGGDVITFIECSLNCTRGEAIRHAKQLAGMANRSVNNMARKFPVAPVIVGKEAAPAQQKKPLPKLFRPTSTDLKEWNDKRELGPTVAGLEIAVQRELLFMALTRDIDEAGKVWSDAPPSSSPTPLAAAP